MPKYSMLLFAVSNLHIVCQIDNPVYRIFFRSLIKFVNGGLPCITELHSDEVFAKKTGAVSEQSFQSQVIFVAKKIKTFQVCTVCGRYWRHRFYCAKSRLGWGKKSGRFKAPARKAGKYYLLCPFPFLLICLPNQKPTIRAGISPKTVTQNRGLNR